MIVTVFKNFNEVSENLPLYDVLGQIQAGRFKGEINTLRALQNAGLKDSYATKKKNLPAFTPSGRFEGGRKSDCFQEYSRILCLDFDKVDTTMVDPAREKLKTLDFTRAYFLSPGKGLKVFVEVNSGHDLHEFAYRQVQEFYEKELSLPCDPKCKDITRLCFFSDDPDLYVNKDSKIFQISVQEQSVQQKATAPPIPQSNTDRWEKFDFKYKFQGCIWFTNQKGTYSEGNRNNYIYLLASNCNREGIPEHETLSMIKAQFDLHEGELLTTVRSAYNHHSDEHVKFGDHQPEDEIGTNEDEESQGNTMKKPTPTIPAEFYSDLPRLLDIGCGAFKTNRQRDIYITSALTILSGCLPGVSGTYDNQLSFANLFCMIVGPPASDKSILKYAKMLAAKYHQKLLAESNTSGISFRDALRPATTDANGIDPNSRVVCEVVNKSLPRVHYIPGNSSSAAIIQFLKVSKSRGTICETEIDTLTGCLKQDWGNFTEILRKAFHHEPISSGRKLNNEFNEIELSRLTIALSGTPDQVPALINSAADGSHSRFIYYSYDEEIKWRSVAPDPDKPNFTEFFSAMGDEVVEMIQFTEEHPCKFELTMEQWTKLDVNFSKKLNEICLFVSKEVAATVKRLGLILYRIAMILSSLRKFENRETNAVLICSDQDFQKATIIAEVYLEHAISVYMRLPKKSGLSDGKPMRLFQDLPIHFQRIDAIKIGEILSIKPRTVDKYLSKMIMAGKLVHPDDTHGAYVKI